MIQLGMLGYSIMEEEKEINSLLISMILNIMMRYFHKKRMIINIKQDAKVIQELNLLLILILIIIVFIFGKITVNRNAPIICFLIPTLLMVN